MPLTSVRQPKCQPAARIQVAGGTKAAARAPVGHDPPTAWRVLRKIASGGDRARRKVTAAVNKARRHAWAQAGGLPSVQVADRKIEGVTCIWLDATVVTAHSDKELAEPDFKGFGLPPAAGVLR